MGPTFGLPTAGWQLLAQCSAAVRSEGADHGGYLRGAVRPGEQAPGSGHGRHLERHAIPLPDWGNRQAPPLVLLHGFTGNARHWDTFARVMAERYRVLALDQRGHGETDWAPDRDYLVARVVDDFAAFVAALGLRHFAVVAFSFGCDVA